MLLQRLAYPVCTAQTGKQAVDMVLVSRPALVITELVLPDMGGLDLLRKLGCDARALPVILLLPTSDSHVEKRNVEIGGSIPCLSKPVQADELYRLVQASIEPTPRSSIRIAMRLPVIVNKVPYDSLKGEYVTDLSEDGLYVRTLRPPAKGEKIAIQIQIEGRDITADASVLYVHRPTEGLFREPGMALRFDRLPQEDRDFIRQFIRERVTAGIPQVAGTGSQDA
jgi:CheY-like chemotaxis protein